MRNSKEVPKAMCPCWLLLTIYAKINYLISHHMLKVNSLPDESVLGQDAHRGERDVRPVTGVGHRLVAPPKGRRAHWQNLTQIWINLSQIQTWMPPCVRPPWPGGSCRRPPTCWAWPSAARPAPWTRPWCRGTRGLERPRKEPDRHQIDIFNLQYLMDHN